MLFWGLLGMVIAELALLLLLLVLPARDDQGKRERDQSKPDREDLLMALGPYSAREEEVEKAPHLERRERAELVSVPVPVAALRQPEPQQKPDPEPTTRVTALPARAQPEPEPEPEPEPDLPPQHRRAGPDAPRARPNTAIAENCQIELWRGYVKCQLYAALLDRPGATGFAFSPAFRLRDENAPTEQAVIALETLIDYLEGDGWTVVFTGRRWYQLRLARCREGF
jgi:hypothetical protein